MSLDSSARRLLVTGKVQGVGFRPFVYRLAQELHLNGWVQNLKGQVLIHLEGLEKAVSQFEAQLISDAPQISDPEILESKPANFEHIEAFSILESEDSTSSDIHIPPDYHMCPDCRDELSDPADRRYRYPFINCTQCGPRFTLIEALPYDRQNTSMHKFPLCPACQKEYEDPGNRRFHAEPVACPECGPSLEYRDDTRHVTDSGNALDMAANALKQGQIVAVKGIGGYHLMCDASNEDSVKRLRDRKSRPDKPLAVLCPAAGEDELDAVRSIAELSHEAQSLLVDPSHPIVLAKKRPDTGLAASIAPSLGEFGVFLPYSPLHHLLLEGFGAYLVATSANLSGEPVLTDNVETEKRLARIADAFLHHNRDIVRPADDSVYRIVADKPRPMRIGRGIAPLEIRLPISLSCPVLALGGQMKNAITLAWGDRMVTSPHIGDLESPRTIAVFENTINDLCDLYEVDPEVYIIDKHPAYFSSKWARLSDKQVIEVSHHHAHASMLPLEYPEINTPWLVFTWDGVGYGEDGQLWGGEAFLGSAGNWQRVASFRPFKLSGGDRAGREPWRSAASLCWETDHPYPLSEEQELARMAWERDINSPVTSAAGRLFDAASSLIGLIDMASFEGQGPMMLEALCQNQQLAPSLPLNRDSGIWLADWAPLVAELSDDAVAQERRAELFHATMASTLIAIAGKVREERGECTIGLSGGVFQNNWLCRQIAALGEQHEFKVYIPSTIPCNDGGLSAGQVMEAAPGLSN
jgi:hydrogenase maturation protein HypF